MQNKPGVIIVLAFVITIGFVIATVTVNALQTKQQRAKDCPTIEYLASCINPVK